jgi:hypothetical protein
VTCRHRKSWSLRADACKGCQQWALVALLPSWGFPMNLKLKSTQKVFRLRLVQPIHFESAVCGFFTVIYHARLESIIGTLILICSDDDQSGVLAARWEASGSSGYSNRAMRRSVVSSIVIFGGRCGAWRRAASGTTIEPSANETWRAASSSAAGSVEPSETAKRVVWRPSLLGIEPCLPLVTSPATDASPATCEHGLAAK